MKEEGIFEAEDTTGTDGAAQDAAQNVAAAFVGWNDAIGNREGKAADMVGNDAEGDIDRIGHGAAVFFAAHLFQHPENRGEYVGFIIGDNAGEVGEILGALDNRAGAFKAHAGVDVLRGQRRKGTIDVCIELHKDEVPDFDAFGAVGVDHLGTAVSFGREVDVQLGTGTARAGVAHHPEVVLAVAGHNTLFGQMAEPERFSF